MKKLFIETYGCQMNVADSEVVASVMQMAGYELCEKEDDADAIFLNTCSIRENAENKIYNRLETLHAEQKKGHKVILGAADTFRAAAADQLKIWGERVGCDVIAHQEGADPAAVVFDAIAAAKSRGCDVLLVDTAGRLQNKVNLMNELAKIRKIIDREAPDSLRDVLLVLDATTGQNALNQAKVFKDTAGVTGVILTKLDGTAKGGVVIGVKAEYDLPVKYIGVGEQKEHLQVFNPRTFAEALFLGFGGDDQSETVDDAAETAEEAEADE